MKRFIPLLIIVIFLVSAIHGAGILPAKAQSATIPTISIVSVVGDQSVTIRTHNFPANQTFTARMGAMGTRGVGGIVVGTTQSGAGGSFLVTYDIPASLRGSSQIAIRLESPQGYFSYNWFVNTTDQVSPSPTPAPGTPRPTPYQGFPSFSIVSVVRDQSVTIRTNNLPANQTFTARMGPMGTRGVGGTVVGTTQSGEGGSILVTYDIPAALRSSSRISIRMDSPQGFFAYNWFFNSSTGDIATPVPGTPAPTPTPGPVYSGIPTFTIVSVVRDTSVNIRTNNFPPNQTFTARMGPMGTRGVGGTVVGTTEAGAGGTLNLTYNIPDNLRGSRQISIRLESPAGYFAYNWFHNTTAP
jgi:hypothetical protein